MGYLSYLPDFKNIKNLQEEMKLYTSDSNQFEVLIYKEKGNAKRYYWHSRRKKTL